MDAEELKKENLTDGENNLGDMTDEEYEKNDEDDAVDLGIDQSSFDDSEWKDECFDCDWNKR